VQETPPGWGKGFSPFPLLEAGKPDIYHPVNSTYANRVDFTGILAGVQQRILDVDLPVGQPYTIQIAEIAGAFPAPVGLTGGPTVVQLTISSSAGYGAAENVQVNVGRNQSTSINHNGPVAITATPLNTVTGAQQAGPVIAVWITTRPAVPISWPIDTTIEGLTVGPAFTTIAANQGFPSRYRPFLTLLADGNIDVQTIDRGGLAVAQWLALTPQLLASTFRRTPMDPQTRIQLRQGAAPAANTISIIWTDN
jgi:hypothetical protein